MSSKFKTKKMKLSNQMMGCLSLFASLTIANQIKAQDTKVVNGFLMKADSLVLKADLNYVQFLADDDMAKDQEARKQMSEAITVLEDCLNAIKYDSKEIKRVTELRDICKQGSSFLSKTSSTYSMKKNKSIKFRGETYKVTEAGKTYYNSFLEDFEKMWIKNEKKAMM